ncbi:MAG: T9SS type A sorting domain-containing protein [Bacteroidales bacterium]|nr:T9SS type A sorting domain-containing protein [Bacteroidales bacterium]
MKKILFVSFFCLLASQCFSQIYAPDSAATWSIVEEYSQGLDEYYFHTLPYNDDTLIGGFAYSKLYELPGTYPGNYKGAYRVDTTGKVLFIPTNDTSEVLLRDFGVVPGDTVNDIYLGFSGYTSHHGSPSEVLIDCVVDSIAYFDVGPHSLKAVYLSVDSSTSPTCYQNDLFWIEIIGNPIGGIFNLLHLDGAIPVDMYGLWCMSYQDTIYSGGPFFIYYDPHFSYYAGTCTVPTSVDNNYNNLSFSLYPNPVAEKLFIKSGLKTSCYITIKSMSSENLLVYKNVDIDKIFELDVSNFKQGVYLLSIYTDNSITPIMFVKQ